MVSSFGIITLGGHEHNKTDEWPPDYFEKLFWSTAVFSILETLDWLNVEKYTSGLTYIVDRCAKLNRR